MKVMDCITDASSEKKNSENAQYHLNTYNWNCRITENVSILKVIITLQIGLSFCVLPLGGSSIKASLQHPHKQKLG